MKDNHNKPEVIPIITYNNPNIKKPFIYKENINKCGIYR